MERVELFEENRKLLAGIAYRMLGSAAEAGDIVQEAYLRWQRAGEQEIQSPKAYLTTIVTRLAMDHLASARVQRELYVGPWLPEPVVETPDTAALAESLSMALLVLLESLTPIERAVFLLREAFDYDYQEIAGIVGKSEANCRQIYVRAREHIADRRPKFDATPAEQERLTQRFLETIATGDLPGLVSVLADDITLWSDGGGKAVAAREPIHGSDRVARFLLGIYSKRPADLEVRMLRVNGEPGVVTYAGGRVLTALVLEIGGGRIRAVRTVVNPDKLQGLPAWEN